MPKKRFTKFLSALQRKRRKKYPILKTMPHMRYHPNNLMIEPADKYAGITRVMKFLNGDMADVVVFGDGWNDMDMFSKAPMSIAMGNSVDALKEIATFVTKGADDGGIEYACRHFGWI